jgi:TIR domain-containing protein
MLQRHVDEVSAAVNALEPWSDEHRRPAVVSRHACYALPMGAATRKIFISHSGRDNWLARRVAADLHLIGCETFLDEKDVETGMSIDLEIHKQLKAADDFLILLSPVSVGSEWVLLELGGALALGKNVIPIMVYVGINALPKAITLKLARDINDLEKYYDELRTKLGQPTSAKQPTSRRKPLVSTRALKRGGAVRIISKRPKDHVFNGWVDDMDDFLGQAAHIREVVSLDPAIPVYRLDIDNGDWLWLESWLIPQYD